ncbi:hypothetical protein [Salinimicrobium soli]|uniref:hypothetical protein n=1 Tax=Salinimicrobium soli TaxID=1254399 RepID=UPI003AACA7B8
MKNLFFGTLLLLAFFFPAKSGAQDFNVTAGMGLPELINVGLRVQFGQKQLGVAVGTYPGTSEDNFALSGDFYYHFGGSSEYTSLRPWFLKTGVTYLLAENEWERQTSFLLVPRVGREFNISPKFGIAVEGGLLVILSDKETVKKEREPSFFDFDLDFTGFILPAAGVNFFYRF